MKNPKSNSLYYIWNCDKCKQEQHWPREAIAKLPHGQGLCCFKCRTPEDIRKELN